jgi:4-hydroxyphenylpyruvate dioxygenase
MSKESCIGIERLAALGYYVHHLDRARGFLVGKLDFEEIGTSCPVLECRLRQRGSVLRAGECTLVVVEPTGEGGPAERFLRRHPEGIGALTFEVEDAARAFALIEERGGTPITDVARFEDEGGGGTLAMFSIATPFGDTVFTFVERGGYEAPFPGFTAREAPAGGRNRFGFGAVDHVTANFQTMAPALLWMEHVLGFERFWEVRFHTEGAADHGSGLKSVVMRDPRSGVRIAANEPWRPRYRDSQVSRFAEDHRGDGVQHAALTTASIVPAVRGLRGRGVRFRKTPGAYYDMLPERLQREGVGAIEEDVGVLRELGILVDGGAPGRYLLQIFLEASAGVHEDPEAGPFFFEIIQRKGDEGFGAGNFRALFESIEREQRRAREAA